MAADKAELRGVALPQPGGEAQAVLDARIPEFGSARNPLDITAQVLNDPDSLRACAGALFADPAYGAVVLPNGYAYDFATPRFALLGELAAQHGKAACVVWLTEWLEGPGAREAEANPRVGLFRSMERCFAALSAWQERGRRRASGRASATRLSPPRRRPAPPRCSTPQQERRSPSGKRKPSSPPTACRSSASGWLPTPRPRSRRPERWASP